MPGLEVKWSYLFFIAEALTTQSVSLHRPGVAASLRSSSETRTILDAPKSALEQIPR